MKRILHILKKRDDRFPLEVIQKEAGSGDVTVVLIQEAVSLELNGLDATVLVLSEDSKETTPTSYPRIGYKEMLDLIFRADTVVTW